MSKYARPVPVDGQTRMVDVVDTAVYEPRPAWGQSDAELLDHIFSPSKSAWAAAGQWFVQVCDGVQSGAIYSGPDYMEPAAYFNPDGSNGSGEFPPGPDPVS